MAQPARRRVSEPSFKRRKSLAARYRISVKTVIKWRSRATTQDSRMGPAKPCSAKLTTRQNREHSIGDQSSALKLGFWSTYEGFRSSARSVVLLRVAKR